jgi:hypothetical protein
MIADPKNEPVDAKAQALAERRRRRARRRFAAWGAFLLLGLLLGAIYATGFATTGGGGSGVVPTAVTGEAGENEDEAELKGLLTSSGSLTWSWLGRWGSVATKAMYEIDLSGKEAGEKFFAEVVLNNTPTKFSDLQLQFRIAKPAVGKTCTEAESLALLAAAGAEDRRVMVFDAVDAQVTFSGMEGATTGLPGASDYCIGIVDYSGAGKDTGGTFIRKSEPGATFTGEYPTFIGTLNRM